MKQVLVVWASLILIPLSAWAQEPPLHDALLDHMVGKWVLRGTIGGAETTHDIYAEWVLGHEYVRLHEVSR